MTKKEFGDFLKQLRESRGQSVRGLSKITGITKAEIRNIEKGIFIPRPQTLLKLSRGLNEDYEVLFEMAEDIKK